MVVGAHELLQGAPRRNRGIHAGNGQGSVSKRVSFSRAATHPIRSADLGSCEAKSRGSELVIAYSEDAGWIRSSNRGCYSVLHRLRALGCEIEV